LVLDRDLPAVFPVIVHNGLPPVVRAAPPLKQEAIHPLPGNEHLAWLGIGRDIGGEAVEALGKARRHRDRKQNLLRR
jgi:hypothetical protein